MECPSCGREVSNYEMICNTCCEYCKDEIDGLCNSCGKEITRKESVWNAGYCWECDEILYRSYH